jgi:hypothetical protein
VIITVYRSVGLLHVKYRLLWAGFNVTWIFSTDFRQILKYQVGFTLSWATKALRDSRGIALLYF